MPAPKDEYNAPKNNLENNFSVGFGPKYRCKKNHEYIYIMPLRHIESINA
jgi:hypothetical protein